MFNIRYPVPLDYPRSSNVRPAHYRWCRSADRDGGVSELRHRFRRHSGAHAGGRYPDHPGSGARRRTGGETGTRSRLVGGNPQSRDSPQAVGGSQSAVSGNRAAGWSYVLTAGETARVELPRSSSPPVLLRRFLIATAQNLGCLKALPTVDKNVKI